MTAPKPQPPTLAEVIAMVEALTMHPKLGRAWRKTALALSEVQVDQLDGIVLSGLVVERRAR